MGANCYRLLNSMDSMIFLVLGNAKCRFPGENEVFEARLVPDLGLGA
jgi:hypothetical protein